MPNCEFTADLLFKILVPNPENPLKLTSPELRGVAEAFDNNLYKFSTLVTLPEFIARASNRVTLLTEHAKRAVLGENINQFHRGMDEQQMQEAGEKMAKAVELLNAELDKTNPNRHQEEHENAIVMLDGIFGPTALRPAMLALESIYISLLVNIWTSFEVLATDLWIAATNARPTTLGDIAIKSPKIREQSLNLNPVEAKQKDDLASISLDALAKYGYDIKNKIGTIVYETQKFSFNRFANIHKNYKVSFKEEADALFKRHNQVRMLEAVRNVLTHRAGVIDNQFKDCVAKDARLIAKNLNVGEKLNLSAGDVTHYVNATIIFGSELLQYVDAWLVKHQN